ncbi:peptidase M56 [Roseiconus nitratireducens]|uniref:Peptidase M56 n=1 Tax=Roseiconus nitratireducens TaxID=2605748 RepID=A0A5M6CW62_9BACT|nr:M56 family metallopeptidase [Roseiconus nitratireducens]KAA5539467.1 peptidase M56 [Roseiconus nitratireducens]
MMDLIELGFLCLTWVGLAAWKSIPVFLLIFLISGLFRKRIPAAVQCLLWMIVVARLLIPFSVASPYSVSSAVDGFLGTTFASESRLDAGPAVYYFAGASTKPINSSSPRVALDFRAKDQPIAAGPIVGNGRHGAVEDGVQGRVLLDQRPATPALIGWTLVLLWGGGVLVLAVRGFLGYIRFSLRLRRADTIEDPEVVDRVLRACDRVGVGRRPKLKEASWLEVPAVFGFVRPVICLPSHWRKRLSGERFDWVLLHELAHVRRRDSLVLLIAGAARTLHWFHPLSWVASSRLRQSIEQAADQLATRHLHDSQVREYGRMLLDFAGLQTPGRQAAGVGLLAMSASRGLNGRIKRLAGSRRPTGWVAGIAMTPVVLLVAACSLTDAETIHPPTAEPYWIANSDTALSEMNLPSVTDLLTDGSSSDAARRIDVNVETILAKASELQPGIDAERFVKAYFVPFQGLSENESSATIIDGKMSVWATPQQEVQMKQMMAGFEKSGPWQIVTDLRIMITDVRALNHIDWSREDRQTFCKRLADTSGMPELERWETAFASQLETGPNDAGGPASIEHSVAIPIRTARISRRESDELINRIQSNARANLMQAPKVTMFNGQQGVVSDVVLRPFVTDVSLQRGELGAALQPKISVFESGWKFHLNPTVASDGGVDFRMIISQSSINGVQLASLPGTASNDPDGQVTIQVPSLTSDSIAVKSHLAADQDLLIFSPLPYDTGRPEGRAPHRQGKGQVFLIRTERISDFDVLANFVPTRETVHVERE